jgi:tetratricopeptide (TPR) repeat protein
LSVERSALNVERSAPRGAVFLSYASQDTEVARTLCEALRVAGLEVWFDQSELVGGDAWDAKIRGQIASCGLFVPLISAHTEARLEGYFRLEWKLASQRTHTMADEKVFLLPVVIDDTRDSAAKVPAEFRVVQWTRLSRGENSETFCARVSRLLNEETTPASFGQALEPRLAATRGPARRVPPLLGALAVVSAVVLALWRPWHSASPEQRGPAATAPTATAPQPSARVSEARQLLAKAWVQLKKPELARAELEAADLICKRAADLDPADAEVWATWTHVHAWMLQHKFDYSDARRAAAEDCVARAIRLDPGAFESRLAQATYRQIGRSVQSAKETERLIRELIQERPADLRAMFLLGSALLRAPETRPEGLATLERVAQHPEFAALAWLEIGWYHHNRTRDMQLALEAAEKSIAVQPFWHNLGLKAQLAAIWLGDLDLALATAQRLKPADRREDWAVSLFYHIYQMRREPKELLKFLNSVPRDWISSNHFIGPKAFLTGWARAADGEVELARRDGRHALDLIEKRLVVEPNNSRLLAMKAMVQFVIGEEAEARKTYDISLKLGGRSSMDPYWLFEPPDRAWDRLEANPPLAAFLRLHPDFDALRNHPRFAALQARLDADPRKSPHAPRSQSTGNTPAEKPPAK